MIPKMKWMNEWIESAQKDGLKRVKYKFHGDFSWRIFLGTFSFKIVYSRVFRFQFFALTSLLSISIHTSTSTSTKALGGALSLSLAPPNKQYMTFYFYEQTQKTPQIWEWSRTIALGGVQKLIYKGVRDELGRHPSTNQLHSLKIHISLVLKWRQFWDV